MAQVGRIGGHLLFPNLERNGADLAFKNTAYDQTPILYLLVDPRLDNPIATIEELQVNEIYKIRDPGNLRFTLAGAPDNNPGTIFRATRPIIGFGDAYWLRDDTDPSPSDLAGPKIGLNTDTPVYDLDVNSNISSTNFIIGNQGYIDNVSINVSDTFSTVSGPLNLTPEQSDPLITTGKLISDNLQFNDNTLSSFDNSNIVLDTNGTGRIIIDTNTTINSNLTTTGDILLDGNLSAAEDIIVGDTPFDTVTVGTDFTQTLEPATDNTFNIGSADKRWANLWSDDWQTADTLTITGMIVSDQLRIEGISGGEIFALQSNDGVILSPDTGITFVEDTKWETNNITNMLNTPLTFTSTGIGYLRFMGDNGVVIPAGGDASRPSSPETGDTRWNTDGELLECFDAVTGTYITSIGPGEVVTQDFVEELGNIYSLILG